MDLRDCYFVSTKPTFYPYIPASDVQARKLSVGRWLDRIHAGLSSRQMCGKVWTPKRRPSDGCHE